MYFEAGYACVYVCMKVDRYFSYTFIRLGCANTVEHLYTYFSQINKIVHFKTI